MLLKVRGHRNLICPDHATVTVRRCDYIKRPGARVIYGKDQFICGYDIGYVEVTVPERLLDVKASADTQCGLSKKLVFIHLHIMPFANNCYN